MNTYNDARRAASLVPNSARAGLASLLLACLSVVVAACGITGDATAIPTRVPPTPTVFRIVVTRTPLPTPTHEPTATLPFDVGGVAGAWALDVRFTVHDNPVFNDVQYIGAAALNIDGRGNMSGAVEFYANVSPSASQAGCTTSVLDSAPITARIEGALRPGDGGGVLGDITLMPDDPLAVTSLWLFCPDFAEPYQTAEPIFWPALRAASTLSFTLPLQSGARHSSDADLSGPSGGGLHGLLHSDIRLSR